jgi:hypothetical protein
MAEKKTYYLLSENSEKAASKNKETAKEVGQWKRVTHLFCIFVIKM